MNVKVLIPETTSLQEVVNMFKKIDMVLFYEGGEFVAIHKDARGMDGKKIGEMDAR